MFVITYICVRAKRRKTVKKRKGKLYSNCKLEQAEYRLRTSHLTKDKISYAVQLSFQTLQPLARSKILFLQIPIPEFTFASKACREMENLKSCDVIISLVALESETSASAHAHSSSSRHW